jgi:hypothetical protein
MLNINYINQIVTTKFNNSTYYAKQRGLSVGSSTLKPTHGELKYWVDKIVNNRISETLFNQMFDEVYSDKASTFTLNDVIGQSFYINEDNYPNGIFLGSISVFFKTKDTVAPITLKIVPTVNGYPSSDIVLPMSQVTIFPEEISIPATTNTLPSETKFVFPAPIYLKPGVYVFTLNTNSKNYDIFISERGKVSFIDNTVVVNPYIGDFFQSQQGTTWSVDQTKDLCFVINRCVFETGEKSFIFETDQYDGLEYDGINLKALYQDFGEDTDINFKLKSYTFSGEDTLTQTEQTIDVNKNIQFDEVKTLDYANGAIITVNMTNKNNHVSPLLDLETFNMIVLENQISDYDANTSLSELTPTSGNSIAKYLTKTVTLAEGFDSNGLTVYIDVNRPVGTDIEVFYKVQNKYDFTNTFEEHNWVKLSKYTTSNQGTTYTTSSDFIEETYQNLAISYTANTGTESVTYSDFNQYQIKVVMYSDNSAQVPKIKNLRAIATL